MKDESKKNDALTAEGAETERASSRRELLTSLGAKSALVFGVGAAIAACADDVDDDDVVTEECPDDTVQFDDVIVGDTVDGTMTDYSPVTGEERTAIPSACWQCVCRDGIICYVEDGRLAKIEGNPRAQKTRGKICAKGQGGIGQVYDPDRLLFPMRRVAGTARGDHQWERISWDDALTELTAKMAEARAADPKYFMFHYGRMKGSSSKLAKSYFLPAFGSKSYAGHTAICESNKWTSQELVWGKHYDVNDVINSSVIVNFGSNPLAAHTSHIPFATRLSEAIHEGAETYTFDVRLSETAAKSTKWLPIKPGTDLAVVLAMTYHIVTNDLAPQAGIDFINDWSNVDPLGFDSKFERLRDLLENPADYISACRDADPDMIDYWDPDDQPAGGFTPAWAEGLSGVSAADIEMVAEAYAAGSPGSTIISYRGAVMHFNGTVTENAVQMLEGLCGNIDREGGRVHGVGASWSYSSTFPKPSNDTTGLSVQNDDAYVAPSHHASHQVLKEIRAAAPEDRPMVYLVYCYTPAYANGDMQDNIDVLKDESLIPYIVVSDVAYTEAAMYADLILPDATYLERWDWEDMVSYDMVPEFYIRQPVISPLGEVRNMQDVLIDLAGRLSEGGDDPLEDVAAVGSMENFVEAACNDTEDVDNAGTSAGYANGFDFMTAEGAWHDPSAEPKYGEYDNVVDVDLTDPETVDDEDEDDYVFMDEEGIVWECTKAEFNDGYRNTSKSYKHYVGQVIDDSGTVYEGFAPDKINKSGFFELQSVIMEMGHYPGLPVWMRIPEHDEMGADELILTTFKLATQIHSRSQNCKYLSELDHSEGAWINASTAASLGIADGDEITITRTAELINDKDMIVTEGTARSSITVTAKVVQGIHPKVIAVSHHFDHWAYGRYATAGEETHPLGDDADYTDHGANDVDKDEIWWNSKGFRPNWIMPNAGDPIGGGLRFMDTVVSVSPA